MESRRASASLMNTIIKQETVAKYDKWVQPRELYPGDLMLRRADIGVNNFRDGKLDSKWEGSHNIKASIGNMSYTLDTLPKEPIPRMWNPAKLEQHYS